MAGKADFDEQEWETLEKGVTGAGLLVAVSDKGFFDTFGEATTMAKHLAAGSGSDSPLVRDLAHTRAHGFSMRSSPQEIEQQTLDGIRSATAIIGQKSPSDLDAYRAFVIDIAQSVAEAKKGVAPSEADSLEKIKAALSSS
jgi:hypothetical protein